jgi:hypothetical protein
MSADERERLEQEFEALTRRTAVKGAEREQARRDVEQLVAGLVDGEPTARAGLLKKRADLRVLIDVSGDELAELRRRTDASDLARYELPASEARAVACELDERRRAARLAAGAAVNAELAFLNRGGRAGGSLEKDGQRVALATEVARRNVEAGVLQRDAECAGNLLARTENALSEARERAAHRAASRTR